MRFFSFRRLFLPAALLPAPAPAADDATAFSSFCTRAAATAARMAALCFCTSLRDLITWLTA
jgi:hypothetical protein